ncbi:MAG: hypothetical protein A4E28_01271 [Methanocella sp. PtaU1.Bin125]|nr:MAG: hypothetical protein A4E28_01271 [Methanocella sp. PtaU1.Bin125]
MNDYAALTGALMRRLGLTHAPVAISLLPELPASARMTEPLSFCAMWTAAMGGEVVYATAKEEACGGGAYFMGLTEITPEMRNGVLLSHTLHLHRTPMAAVRTMQASPAIPYGTGAAVVCAPLEKAGFDVDVVLIVCTPAAAMKFADAVSFDTGGYLAGKTGPATCSVAVAGPYLSGQPTFCVADSGAREYMKLEDGEMIISFPGDRLVAIVRNLEEMAQHPVP